MALKNQHKFIEWLVSKQYINSNNAFIFSNNGGHFETVKWLITNYPNVGVHEKCEYVFRVSCCDGYIEIDIRMCDDTPFVSCCEEQRRKTNKKSKYLETTRWLTTLCFRNCR